MAGFGATPKTTFSFGTKPATPLGSTATPATSTFTFGSKPATPTTGGGLFGAKPATPTANTVPATGSLFGNTASTATTGGLFGQAQGAFTFTVRREGSFGGAVGVLTASIQQPQQALQQASSELEQKLMQLMLAYDRSQVGLCVLAVPAACVSHTRRQCCCRSGSRFASCCTTLSTTPLRTRSRPTCIRCSGNRCGRIYSITAACVVAPDRASPGCGSKSGSDATRAGRGQGLR